MDLTIPYFNSSNPEGACDELINKSVAWWKKEDDVVDDITAVSIFLN